MSLVGKSKRVRKAMRNKFVEVYEAQQGDASKTRKILGLSVHIFDRWMEKDPKFAAKIIAIDEAIIDSVEVVLLENAKSGKQRAIEFFLLNRRRKKYRNTQRSEITGADGGPISYEERVYEDPNSTTPLTQREAEDIVKGKTDE